MLSLLRFGIENSTLVDRASMQNALSMTTLNGVGRTVEDLCPRRHPNDAVRAALSYILQQLPTIQHREVPMRLIRAEAKVESKTSIKIDIHLQKRGSAVNYYHVGSFEFDSLSQGSAYYPNPSLDYELYDKLPPELIEWTKKPHQLMEFGMNLFSADVRKIVDTLLVNDLPRLWAGTWLITKEEQDKKAKQIRQVLQLASASSCGKATLNLVTLEESKENRDTLGRELSEVYVGRLMSMIEELDELVTSSKFTGKVKARVILAYQELFQESTSIQEHLEVEFSNEFQDLFGELSDKISAAQSSIPTPAAE